jgi:hypothetical protein
MSISLNQNTKKQNNNLDTTDSRIDTKYEISPQMAKIKESVETDANSKFPNSRDIDAKKLWAEKEFLKRATESFVEPIKEQQRYNAELQEKAKQKLSELNGLLIPKVGTEEKKLDVSQNIIKDSKNLNLAFKKGNSFEIHNSTVSIDTSGTLNVSEKDFKGQITDVSKSFKALYLGNDNILRDKDGNQINTIQSAHGGNLTASFVSQMITKRETEGKIYELKNDLLNHFSHEGKQIVFISGTPPIKSGTLKQSEIKEEVQKEKIEEKIQKTSIPWNEYKYAELKNGQWEEKSAYIRMNNSSGEKKLEVFIGKNKDGTDIWKDAREVQTPKLEIVLYNKQNGEMTTQSGTKVSQFGLLDGKQIISSSAAKLIDQSDGRDPNKSGLLGLGKRHINDLMINGKRPVFIEI